MCISATGNAGQAQTTVMIELAIEPFHLDYGMEWISPLRPGAIAQASDN